MTAMDMSRPGIIRRRMPPVAWWPSPRRVAFSLLQLFILRRLASVSFASFLGLAPRPIFRLTLFTIPSSHFLALLPEDHLLEPQQRDLLFLQLAHQVEQASQQPGNHSFILLAQCVLLDFFDQGFDFGRIDFGYLVVRFSHLSYLYSERHDLWPIFSIYGAELSRLILSSLISEVTHHCRSFTIHQHPLQAPFLPKRSSRAGHRSGVSG